MGVSGRCTFAKGGAVEVPRTFCSCRAIWGRNADFSFTNCHEDGTFQMCPGCSRTLLVKHCSQECPVSLDESLYQLDSISVLLHMTIPELTFFG